MDITTILGIILGFVVIVFGIGLDKIGNFWDPDSIIIVVGGTLCAVLASYPLKALKNIGKHMLMLVKGGRYKPEKAIDTLVEFAQLARKNGLLTLEEKARELKDPFFRQGILLIVDAMDEEKVRGLLEDELANMEARHEEGAAMYDKAAAFAPAFGMIGTLVGLINMLKGMDLSSGAQSSIGVDMSVALVTTFYGCILANLLFMPIAKKLRIRNEEEMLYKQIIIEGVLGIQAGDNPKTLREQLCSFLSQKQSDKLLNGKEGGKKGGKGGAEEKAPRPAKGKK